MRHRCPGSQFLDTIGGPRRKAKSGLLDTSEALRVGGHVHLCLEFADKNLLEVAPSWGWTGCQPGQAGAPAVFWRTLSFAATDVDASVIYSHVGAEVIHVCSVSLKSLRPGWTTLGVAAAHIHHKQAKKHDVAFAALSKFRPEQPPRVLRP